MQAVARRLLICGMHVHVGIDDEDMRIDLMNQAHYFADAGGDDNRDEALRAVVMQVVEQTAAETS
mgnify:FL=1|tara:strand:- start:11951 stop:12145 length:195 start_codon:yes stop_codon:yes gene_type:complete